MLVIIEGPDRTGKTTLANALRDEYGWPIVHAGKPERHPLQEYVLSIEQDHRRHGPIVFDRWHLGEWVYPQLYPEGRRPLAPEHWLWIELFLRARGAYLIVTNDDPYRIERRLAKDPESYLRTPEAVACSRLFNQAYQHSILDRYPVVLTDPRRFGVVVARVGEIARGRRSSEPYTLGRPPNDRGGLLLVGDELGTPNPPEATHEVPFAPYPQVSGWYLMQAILRWDQRDQRRLQVVNSLQPNGELTDLRSLYERFKPERVVALGTRAADRLWDAGVSHARLRHPQFVRRFEHRRLAQYSRQLLQTPVHA